MEVVCERVKVFSCILNYDTVFLFFWVFLLYECSPCVCVRRGGGFCGIVPCIFGSGAAGELIGCVRRRGG